MCFDWPRYKNPVSRVETECRIVVSGEYYGTYVLIKAKIQLYPQVSAISYSWLLINTAQRSVRREKYYKRSIFMKAFAVPFHNTLNNKQTTARPLINTTPSALPNQRVCRIMP